MTRFPIISLITLSLFVACGIATCGAIQTQRPSLLTLSGTRFDMDINGNFFVVDRERNLLRKFSKEQSLEKEIGGTGWSDDQFDQPAGIWARDGIDIFVADFGNHRIQRFDRNLAFISSFSTRDRSNPDERFGYPTDVAISRLGDLFICDSENSRILKVVGLSKVERTFGGFDAGNGRLQKPRQVEIGPNDNVYVQDAVPDGRKLESASRHKSRVVVFDSFGNFIRVLGEGVFTGDISICADENGVIILGDAKLFFFDKDDRPLQTIELASLNVTQPIAFIFTRGKGYFLTTAGLAVITDPRTQQ
jgi:DNA-binding beta-propeller fold protein YncE